MPRYTEGFFAVKLACILPRHNHTCYDRKRYWRSPYENRSIGGFATVIDSRYRSLCRVGGVGAWAVVVLTVSEVVFFILYPQPATTGEWFSLFRQQPLVGILDFWGLELPMYAMFVLVFLALYAVLEVESRSAMTVVLAFALIGAAVFFATNNPFSMLTLSRQHALAATDVERSALRAAGHAVLAATNQRAVGGFNVALLFITIAGVVTSVVMLRTGAFGRVPGIVGIIAHSFSLADYIRQAATSSAVIALLVIVPGALLVAIWFAAVGIRLWRFGSEGPTAS